MIWQGLRFVPILCTAYCDLSSCLCRLMSAFV
nr:MAG TPA: hypothetical protein [Caudoviricetes sp.]